MKLTNIFATLLAFTFLFSCSSEETSEENVTSEVVEESTEEEVSESGEEHLFNEFGEDFKLLVVSFEGIVRGVDIGTSMSDVKSIEKGDVLEESDNMIGYSIQLSQDETAKVMYSFDDDKVSEISLKVSVGTQDEMDAMVDEFTAFFHKKYGNPTIDENSGELWKPDPSKEHLIDVIEISEGDNLMLEVLIK